MISNLKFFVLKFFFFIMFNFFLVFQIFFSSNFFFMQKFDEEFVICLAIFLVFFLTIKQINENIENMLKLKTNLYIDCFILTFRLTKKFLKRFKQTISHTFGIRNVYINFIKENFFNNLNSFSKHQKNILSYSLHKRIKCFIENVSILMSFSFNNNIFSISKGFFIEKNFQKFLKNVINFQK